MSGWFKDVHLTQRQKEKLEQDWRNGLVSVRKKAVLWHNAEKERRIQEARKAAEQTFARIDTRNMNIMELALAVLYFGEGSKKNVETSMGNSDRLILRFFLKCLGSLYGFDIQTIRCELYLRADQNPERMKTYWSRELGLLKSQFKQVNIDRRTEGSRTYPYYKGVCNLRCGHVAVQRKLLYLSKMFFENIASQH